jgi:hypothetical protein
MDHMHHMQQAQSGFDWLSMLSLFFFAGTIFYVFRFVNGSYMQRVNGYIDRENEFWHGVCLLGMSAMLTPQFFPLAGIYWAGIFGVGTIWFLVRAFTYGRKLSHNKQWYDFAHAAMLFGMGWMFAAPFSHPLVTVIMVLYWTWFGGYYLYRLSGDFKKPHWLTIGQDIAHFAMALVMVLMTIWPATFMPGHNHSMPPDAVICGPSRPSEPAADTDSTKVAPVTSDQLDQSDKSGKSDKPGNSDAHQHHHH